MLHFGVGSWSYPQTLYLAGKACQGQIRLVIANHELKCFEYRLRTAIKAFQPSLWFVSKARAPVKHLSDAPLWGRLLVLPTNNRLGWKALPRTNTQVYLAEL